MKALWRVFGLVAVCVAAGSVAAGSSFAGGPGGGNSADAHVANLAKQAARLQADGKLSAPGSLSALADCNYGATAQVFLPWGDAADYNLAPQGDLAASDSWSLDGATVVAAHDPYSGAAGSVELTGHKPSAESPVTCVNLNTPTMRFFVSHAGPQSKSALEVYVLYQDTKGKTRTLTLATVNATDTWQPSPVIPIGVNVLGPVSIDGWTPVSFGFTTQGLKPGESYSIDGRLRRSVHQPIENRRTVTVGPAPRRPHGVPPADARAEDIRLRPRRRAAARRGPRADDAPPLEA